MKKTHEKEDRERNTQLKRQRKKGRPRKKDSEREWEADRREKEGYTSRDKKEKNDQAWKRWMDVKKV